MNRETYPASQSPLSGDISAPAGATLATVVGLQTNPVSTATPADKDALRWHADNGDWEPTTDGNVKVTLGTYATAGGAVVSKGIPISDDLDFSVNNIAIDGLVGWSHGTAFDFFVNGVGVL